VPRRNPQFRQKRNSDGIAEWQFEQVIVVPDDGVISGFCDITNQTFLGLRENNRRFFYTPNNLGQLQATCTGIAGALIINLEDS
jgi:hypothetical protein